MPTAVETRFLEGIESKPDVIGCLAKHTHPWINEGTAADSCIDGAHNNQEGGAEEMPLPPSAKVNLDIPWIWNEPSGHVLSTWTAALDGT